MRKFANLDSGSHTGEHICEPSIKVKLEDLEKQLNEIEIMFESFRIKNKGE